MPVNDKETRDRVRSLVQEMLKSVPPETVPDGGETLPKRVVVNSLKETYEREFDRDESSKTLITEVDLRGLSDGSRLRVSEAVKFTPLASDIVAEKQIVLIRKASRDSRPKVSSLAIGCDHGGFELKQKLKPFLTDLGINVRDFGTDSKDAVDYPDFAHAVARAVGEGHVEVGLIIDGAGIGSAMAANKVPNVRAAACYSPQLARNSREHNGANVLTIGSGQNSFDEVKQIIEAWLTTELSEDRHRKRVAKIDAIQRQYSK
jgi:ribose 5-phosphate isomerase B